MLGPFLYSEASVNAVLYSWDKDFKRREIPGKRKQYHCAHLEIPQDRPMLFKTTTVKKVKVIPVLGGCQCFCLEQNCKVPHHQESKLLSGSVSLCIYETKDTVGDIYSFIAANKPLIRIHFDRKNKFQERCLCDFSLTKAPTALEKIQPGAAFHNQFGGGGSSIYPLDVPRIPSYPLDIVLLTDLVLRNFYPRNEASEVLDKQIWKSMVRQSFEQLIIPWKNGLDKEEDGFFFA